MSEPYIGEIRLFAGNFAPVGWALCDGQLLPISENDALFTLIGTTYGGDGQETFGLPNLQSRIPIHQGSGFVLGQMVGTEEVTLTTQQMPVHSHVMLATNNLASGTAPASLVLAASTEATVSPYGTDAPLTQLHPSSITPVGGSQPHTNVQPFLCLTFIISLYGIFPSQS